MDNEQFDRLTRLFGQRGSRRGVLGGIALSAVSLVAGRRGTAAQIGTPGGMCGGIAGISCPEGFTCIDNPADDCDPNAGGADCSGICVPADQGEENPCAAMLCMEGTTCCPLCGGVCLPADVPCTEEVCAGEPCNEAICGPGEYCCNESCSTCVPLGEGCTREYCPPESDQPGEPCGMAFCGPGEHCCNESCGICAPIGGSCIELYCEPPEEGEQCGPTVCPPGQVCCNESCGICTPPGGMCIMIACVE